MTSIWILIPLFRCSCRTCLMPEDDNVNQSAKWAWLFPGRGGVGTPTAATLLFILAILLVLRRGHESVSPAKKAWACPPR